VNTVLYQPVAFGSSQKIVNQLLTQLRSFVELSKLGASGSDPYIYKSQIKGLGWWAVLDSNQRPLRCEHSALPAELTARLACYFSIVLSGNGFPLFRMMLYSRI
jgi:hypothetical protein